LAFVFLLQGTSYSDPPRISNFYILFYLFTFAQELKLRVYMLSALPLRYYSTLGILCFFLKMGSPLVAQSGLEPWILQAQPPESWN
jgi:hypothetical protein